MANTSVKQNVDWTKYLTLFSLFVCAVCLALISISLRPVAKWADNQNICVEQEIIKSKAPISWGVRKCNGRSKVYQVK